MAKKTEEAVTFKHFRLPADPRWPNKGEPDTRHLYPYMPGEGEFQPHPRGGATICTIKNGSGTYTGFTLCSLSQNFEYSEGRNKSKRRARMMQQLEAARARKFYGFFR